MTRDAGRSIVAMLISLSSPEPALYFLVKSLLLRFFPIQPAGPFWEESRRGNGTVARSKNRTTAGKINRRDKVLAVRDLFSDSRLLWTPDQLRLVLGYTRPTLYSYLKSLKDCDCI
jgi:hypothetical protein